MIIIMIAETETEKLQKQTITAIIWIIIITFLGYFVFKQLLPKYHNFRRARADGLAVTCMVYLKEIGEALKEYKVKNGQYPNSLSKITPKYIKKIHRCPANGKNYKYILSKDREQFTLFCEGDYHNKTVHNGINYPQYCSKYELVSSEESYRSILNEEKKRKGFPLCQQNLRNIAVALEEYKKEHDGKYPRNLDSLIPEYLKQIPKCPSAEKDTYSSGYEVNGEGDAFTLYCKGLNHYFSGVDENYPRFYSKSGLVISKDSVGKRGTKKGTTKKGTVNHDVYQRHHK